MAHVGREGRLGSSEAPGRILQLLQCPAWLQGSLSVDSAGPGRGDKTDIILCLCSVGQSWARFWLLSLLFGI